MASFDPEHLDLPPPEEHDRGRGPSHRFGQALLGMLRIHGGSERRHGAMHVDLARAEALFDAEAAGNKLKRIVASVCSDIAAESLSWLIDDLASASEARVNRVVSAWRIHNADALASLLEFVDIVHADEGRVPTDELQDFVRRVEKVASTLRQSVSER